MPVERIPHWPAILERVQNILGYEFADAEKVRQALTHSSYSNEDRKLHPECSPLSDNERYEFLGDAVIGLVVAQLLMESFPEAAEGKLSRWRSYLVSRRHLAEIATELQIGKMLLLGQGEKRTGGEDKRSILAAALEALVGAVYLDGGLEAAAILLRRWFGPALSQLHTHYEIPLSSLDHKTYLQELTQSLYKSTPLYRLIQTWGPEHEKTFRVEIHIDGQFVGTGDGRSKKEAEQKAASLGLVWIEERKPETPSIE